MQENSTGNLIPETRTVLQTEVVGLQKQLTKTELKTSNPAKELQTKRKEIQANKAAALARISDDE